MTRSRGSAARSKRTYAGQSLEERRAERRKKLIEAGLELFGTVGRKGTSVRSVCRQAELTDRYFYEQFDTLEDLLAAVLDECANRLQTNVLKALDEADEDLSDIVHRSLDAFFATAEGDPRLARVSWFEALGVSERIDRHYMELNERFSALILLVAAETSGGDPESRRHQVLASASAGGVKETIVRWILNDFSPPRAELVAYMTDFLLATSTVLPETRN